MTTNPNDSNRSSLRTLGMYLLLCGLGIVCIFIASERKDRELKRIRTDLRHIPPEWITYRQTSLFACLVEGEPTCFALLGESTFVIGSANPSMLSLFDEKGTLLRKIDLPEEPRAIVCGTPETILAGKIVVALPTQIVLYHAEGNREASWELPDEQSDIRSLVLTPAHLFAADTGKRGIHRFDANGRWSMTFSRDFVVYASPITMAFSHRNNFLYITNPGKHRVEVFTQDGIHLPELSWGEPSGSLSGFVGCCNPIGLAVLDGGRILTVEKAISRIKIFRAGGGVGELDCVVAGPGTLEDVPIASGRTPAEPGGRYFAAVPLPHGDIAVFDYVYAVVRVFSP